MGSSLSFSLRSGFWFRFDLDRFFDFGSWVCCCCATVLVWVLCWISYSIWILPSTIFGLLFQHLIRLGGILLQIVVSVF